MAETLPAVRAVRKMTVSVGNIQIPDHELQLEFMLSAGPGGQNVNKTSTAVRLTLVFARAASLPEHLRERLQSKLGSSVSVTAREHRTQYLNRRSAEEKLARLLENALRERRKRRPTRPTAASVARRLAAKSRRSAVKRDRRAAPGTEE